ncbi:MAG: M28 family peptidase [Muribaculaceae bacterium]|nr:M28 family peptidase [Muribaculaceae bacterium]
MKLKNIILLIVTFLSLFSCKSQKATEETSIADEVDTQVVNFNASNAYSLVKAQCDFGPRVPGTPAHSKCAEWLEQSLKQNCDTVIVQQGQVTTFDGKILNIKNFIGSFNTSNSDRILLLAHWDCRPWADNDPDSTKHSEPVMGANDAASGVAVLLELARLMKEKKPNIGVDILFVDAEDWGTNDVEDSWALGTQYWAKNPHVTGYTARFGILLDMVGARGAKFYEEDASLYFAKDVVDVVWGEAQRSGYSSYFDPNYAGGGITDDHIVVNEMGIRCIDIIDTRDNGHFFPGWHTTTDTMSWIDQNTLKAVGQVVANVVYSY